MYNLHILDFHFTKITYVVDANISYCNTNHTNNIQLVVM
jgi:hypothetical protein